MMRFIFGILALTTIGCKSSDRERSQELNRIGMEYFEKATSIFFEEPPVDKVLMADSCLYFLSEAIRRDSSNKSAYWNKLACENGLKRFDDAKNTASLYFKKFNDPYGLFSLAGIHRHLGDSHASKKYLMQALEFYEESIKSGKLVEDSVLLDLTLANLYNGNIETSRQYYERYRSTKWGRMTFENIEFDSARKLLEGRVGNAR